MTGIATRFSPKVLQSDSRALLASLFAIDARSLAAVRIGIGVILLYDSLANMSGASPESFHYSSFLIVPFAIALLVGFKTRLASMLCWLIYGLPIREALADGGGGVFYGKYVLVVFLFWTIFLPLGATFSVDAKSVATRSYRILSVASGAILIQLFFIYFFAGINKDLGEWLFEASAMRTILASSGFGTELGVSLAQSQGAMAVLSVTTIALEVAGAILLFLPGRNLHRRRAVLLGIFAAFHLGMAVTMRVRTFPFIMITVLFLLVPSAVWDKVLRSPSKEAQLVTDRNVFRNLTAAVALSYICVSNFFTWASPNSSGFVEKWQDFGLFVLLFQRWAMFSIPSTLV